MKKPSWEIEWSDALSMGNPEIDAEHRHFIKLVNELNDEVMNQQRDKAVVERIMGLILEDAITHFSHEEQLLVKEAYPAVEEHVQIHSELIHKFRQGLKEIHDSDFGIVWMQVGLEIKGMLVDHVLVEDAKYIEYLRAE